MSRATVSYVCGECGGHTLKWQGQCPSCGAWNTLAAGVQPVTKRSGYAGEVKGLRLADVEHAEISRASTGISEFDRVLGGGLVTGSVVLIGGDPGIGKSTLLLQAAGGKSAGTGLQVSGP
jgi:DNA repair protein RadA/Sms